MKRYLWIFSVALLANATSSIGTIKGFRMQTCAAAKICTQVNSPEALQGNWGLITFDDVRVEQIVGGKTQIFEGHDAVFDVSQQTLAIRQVTRGPAGDVILNLSSGNIQLFNPPNNVSPPPSRGVDLRDSGTKSAE